MARKKKPETSETTIVQPVAAEQVPVVTPEIADGYTGTVKRLICTGCQRVFYVTEAIYQSLSPTHCHSCSTRLLAEYEAKKQQEKTEEEQKEKDDIILALADDIAKQHEDTPEVAFVREMVERNPKGDWKYGYKMLLCIPRHTEKGRTWDVTMTKQEEHSHASTHIKFLLIEMSKTDVGSSYFYLPYHKHTFYKTKTFMIFFPRAEEQEAQAVQLLVVHHQTRK